MIEPTESEGKEELDRFCEAMIEIRKEIQEIADGKYTLVDSALRNSPHTAVTATQDEWNRKYSRQKAIFPLEWVKERKFWPSVSRIDNVFGDRNLVCTCGPMEEWE
jgi:glycine dehydrogenase